VGGGVLALALVAAVVAQNLPHRNATDVASAGEPASPRPTHSQPARTTPATGTPAKQVPAEGKGKATLAPAAAPAAPGWTLRWSPQVNKVGLGAFEGIEDDRKGSHKGVTHIRVQGNNIRFDMHKRDRDGSDRQRSEVKGMRAGGANLAIAKGQTWRITYSMYIPSSLKATSSFTHVMQTKMPGNGTAPIMVMSLRKHGSTPKIELKATAGNGMVGATDLAPLQDSWIDIETEFTSDDAPRGRIRWVIRKDGKTVLDRTRTGVDTWMGDRVRPKWGIYRSLKDSSAIQDTHLLLANLKAYQRT
jgi:chitin-binding protein